MVQTYNFMKKGNTVFTFGLGYVAATVLASACMAAAVLSGAVNWPWWVILAPIWVSILIAVLGALTALLLLNYINKNEKDF